MCSVVSNVKPSGPRVYTELFVLGKTCFALSITLHNYIVKVGIFVPDALYRSKSSQTSQEIVQLSTSSSLSDSTSNSQHNVTSIASIRARALNCFRMTANSTSFAYPKENTCSSSLNFCVWEIMCQCIQCSSFMIDHYQCTVQYWIVILYIYIYTRRPLMDNEIVKIWSIHLASFICEFFCRIDLSQNQN